jgi:hypothetical protein
LRGVRVAGAEQAGAVADVGVVGGGEHLAQNILNSQAVGGEGSACNNF